MLLSTRELVSIIDPFAKVHTNIQGNDPVLQETHFALVKLVDYSLQPFPRWILHPIAAESLD